MKELNLTHMPNLLNMNRVNKKLCACWICYALAM